MDAEKNKKLQQYATILADQAKDAEQAGKNDEAIKLYLKLVDVFLVLGSEAQDHNMWSQYIRQAEAYQSRIRTLAPQDSQAPAASAQRPPQTLPAHPPQTQAPAASQMDASQASPTSQAKPGAFSKILKPFQKGETSDSSIPASSSASVQAPSPKPLPPIGKQVTAPQPQLSTMTSPAGQISKSGAAEEKTPVSHELYEKALSENRILHEKLQAVVKERDEKVSFLESRIRELEERISMMIPRSDYDILRAEFDNTVPKQEYERIRTELANSVPISHYNLLLDRVTEMVPREVYLAAERRAMELEDNLRHSVPSDIIDELASEVSLMTVSAEVPPIIADGGKLKKNPDSKPTDEMEVAISKEGEGREETFAS